MLFTRNIGHGWKHICASIGIILLQINLSIGQNLDLQTKVIVQKGHAGWIRCMAISPDGKLLLTGSADQTIILWDALTGRQMKVFSGHKGEVQSLKFFNDNKTFISGSAAGEVVFWNTSSNNPVNGLRTNGPVTSIDISENNEEFALATLHGLVGNCKVKTLGKPTQFKLDSSSHTFVSFTNNSSILYIDADTLIILKDNKVDLKFPISQLSMVSSKKESFTSLHNIKTQSQAQQEKDMRGMETSLISGLSRAAGPLVPNDIYRRPYLLTHDKTILFDVIPTDENIIVGWNIQKRSKSFSISTKLGYINNLAVSKNDSLLAATNEDGIVLIYDIRNQREVIRFKIGDNVVENGIAFNRDGSELFIAISNKVLLVDLKNREKRLTFSGATDTISAIKFSGNGNSILVQQNKSIKVINIKNNSNQLVVDKDNTTNRSFNFIFNNYRTFDLNYHRASLLYENDHIKNFSFVELDSAAETNDFTFRFSKRAIIKENKRTKAVDSINIDIKKKYLLEMGNTIAVYNSSGNLYLVDTRGKMEIQDSITNIREPSSLDLSVDRKYLVYTNSNRSFSVYDIKSKKEVYTANVPYGNDFPIGWGHASIPISVRCNPTKNYCIFTTWSGDMFVFDLEKKREVKVESEHDELITYLEFSNDGNYLLSYSIDNTLRLWESTTGKDSDSLLTLLSTYYFIKDEIITLLPNSYYSGHKESTKYLSFINKQTSYSFEQFDSRLNRPDKVLQAMGSTDWSLVSAYNKAYLNRIKYLRIDTTAFTKGLSLPVCDFANREKISDRQTHNKLLLNIVGKDTTSLLDHYNVWINEVPLFGTRGVTMKSRNTHILDTTLTVHLTEGVNRIETSVFNINGVESYRIPLQVTYSPGTPVASKLYFMGIGIDQFSDNKHNLTWSVRDIQKLSKALKEKYKENIVIDTLFNQLLTEANVRSLKNRLLQTRIDDKVILAYSGHGLFSKNYDYFLSTYNTNFDEPQLGGLPYDIFERLLDSIPARRKLMFLDACHSGEVDKEEMLRYQEVQDKLNEMGVKKGTSLVETDSSHVGMKNSFELMQDLFANVGRSTGATIISAAAGSQLALERNNLQNGVFTYSILEYMQTHSTGKVSELKRYINKRVSELTEGLQVPTTRSETLIYDWSIW